MLVCEFLIAIIGVTISVSNSAGQKVLIAFVCICEFIFLSHFLSARKVLLIVWLRFRDVDAKP